MNNILYAAESWEQVLITEFEDATIYTHDTEDLVERLDLIAWNPFLEIEFDTDQPNLEVLASIKALISATQTCCERPCIFLALGKSFTIYFADLQDAFKFYMSPKVDIARSTLLANKARFDPMLLDRTGGGLSLVQFIQKDQTDKISLDYLGYVEIGLQISFESVIDAHDRYAFSLLEGFFGEHLGGVSYLCHAVDDKPITTTFFLEKEDHLFVEYLSAKEKAGELSIKSIEMADGSRQKIVIITEQKFRQIFLQSIKDLVFKIRSLSKSNTKTRLDWIDIQIFIDKEEIIFVKGEKMHRCSEIDESIWEYVSDLACYAKGAKGCMFVQGNVYIKTLIESLQQHWIPIYMLAKEYAPEKEFQKCIKTPLIDKEGKLGYAFFDVLYENTLPSPVISTEKKGKFQLEINDAVEQLLLKKEDADYIIFGYKDVHSDQFVFTNVILVGFKTPFKLEISFEGNFVYNDQSLKEIITLQQGNYSELMPKIEVTY